MLKKFATPLVALVSVSSLISTAGCSFLKPTEPSATTVAPTPTAVMTPTPTEKPMAERAPEKISLEDLTFKINCNEEWREVDSSHKEIRASICKSPVTIPSVFDGVKPNLPDLEDSIQINQSGYTGYLVTDDTYILVLTGPNKENAVEIAHQLPGAKVCSAESNKVTCN